MVRGIYIERGASERLTLAVALDRYLSEVTPTKKPATQQTEIERAKPLRDFFGKYALAAITPDLVARYRDLRLATPNARQPRGRPKTPLLLSASTVRLELALLGHLFTTAIREWRLGLALNPVAQVRKPKPAEGRDRRLSATEERTLFAAVDAYSNPMLGWIVRIALETGMRSSEITGLRVRQIDTKRRIVRLADTKNDSARTVPMTRTAQALFELALANPLRPAANSIRRSWPTRSKTCTGSWQAFACTPKQPPRCTACVPPAFASPSRPISLCRTRFRCVCCCRSSWMPMRGHSRLAQSSLMPRSTASYAVGWIAPPRKS